MTDTTSPKPKLALMSYGLHKIRHDIASITSGDVSLYGIGLRAPDVFIGWGMRPSSIRAERQALRKGKPVWRFEDGFLKGFAADLAEPPHSYVLDKTGVYFDTARDNDLERLVAGNRGDTEIASWGKAFVDLLRREQITKFNNWTDAGEVPRGSYLLVVDQVAHDASIPGAGATPETFATMIEAAADDAAGRSIVVRTHPAMREKSAVLQAAAKAGIYVSVAPPVNPWRLIEDADALYTISSQMGLEALMAGKTVHCFGQPFYAGRGLTTDRGAATRPVTACSLGTLAGVFYREYLRYLDVHDRTPCSAETAIQQLLTIRRQRRRLPNAVYTGGLSPWKRRAVAPFLTGMGGRPHQSLSLRAAEKNAAADNGLLACWGARQTGDGGPDKIFMEDGFIRSAGLGAGLTLPASLTIDRQRPHYDLRGASDIEELLQNAQFTPEELSRAERLIDAVTKGGITKYNLAGTAVFPDVEEGRTKIFVPGQVETDASILLGSPEIRTNRALVAAVREKFPDAFIVYKPHPDVVSGFRDGGETPQQQDLIATDGNAVLWIDWSDRVETMTSWTGFEALLRGKPVGVHGLPVYAGWGLTSDRIAAPQRSRKLALPEMVAGLLVRYPFYLHPGSRLPCEVETLVHQLAKASGENRKQTLDILAAAAVWTNRLAVRIRDRKNRDAWRGRD